MAEARVGAEAVVKRKRVDVDEEMEAAAEEVVGAEAEAQTRVDADVEMEAVVGAEVEERADEEVANP